MLMYIQNSSSETLFEIVFRVACTGVPTQVDDGAA